MTQLNRLHRDAVRRIEIHTPADKLNDPAVRGGLYGLLVMAGLLQRAAHPPLQLERHAYPGQPSQRPTHTKADQVVDAARKAGIDLLPWQERALRQYFAQPVRPCCCWYTALCCGLVLTGERHYYCPVTQANHHPATGFVINPHCTHHAEPGQANHP